MQRNVEELPGRMLSDMDKNPRNNESLNDSETESFSIPTPLLCSLFFLEATK